MSTSSDTECRIRSVDRAHIGDLIRIGEETNLSHWSARSYLDEMKNPDAVMLRLESDDNTTVGFIVGRVILGGLIEPQTDAEIYNIAVIQPLRKRGHGQSLLDAFIERCRERSVVDLWLEVRESNAGAICFYERNGFEHVQTRNHFYTDPVENALMMRKRLETDTP